MNNNKLPLSSIELIFIIFAVLGFGLFMEELSKQNTTSESPPLIGESVSPTALLKQPTSIQSPPLKCDNPLQMTFGMSGDLYPRWSPDGIKITFHSARKGNYDIWMVSIYGGEPVRITSTNQDDGFASWSPDGESIAFVRFTKSAVEGLGDLFLINSDGSGLIQLTSDGTGKAGLTWSPDGKSIAYSDIGTPDNPNGVIWLLDIETREKQKLVNLGAGGLSFNPEGTHLIFDALNSKMQRWLYMINLSKKEPIPLIQDIDRPWYPQWSPEMNWIAFHAGKGGKDGIWITKPDGTGRNLLTVAPDGNRFPSWSPDGKKIAYTQGKDTNAHIFICNITER